MAVLDASALIAALIGEPAQAEVDSILRRPRSAISAANLMEVIDRLVRLAGHDPEDVRDRLNWLMAGGLEVEPVWLPIARRAASLRARHYHRTQMPVSLADCTCLATALELATEVATTDRHLAELARAVGVPVIALPDSSGRRP